jgi:hypothetical protein
MEHVMNLVQRVQDILLKPQATWPQIEAEPATPASLYKHYIALLALIPAVAGFIGMSLIGVSGFVSFRVPFLAGLSNMVVGYVLSLALVYLLSLLVDALAPSFGGTKNPMNALKLVAYSMTAGFVGGIFMLLPALSVLAMLASLYGVYLLYLGLPVLMKCSQEKALPYTAVIVVGAIIASIIVGALTALLMPSMTPGLRMGAGGGAGDNSGGNVSIKLPGTDITLNSKDIEKATKKMEAAQASGNAAEASKAMGEMMAAMTGAGAPFSTEQLKPFAPEALAGLPRKSFSAEQSSAMGMNIATVKAQYGNDAQNIRIEINDVGLNRLALAGWATHSAEREDEHQTERTYKQGGRTISEKSRKDNSRSEIKMLLENGTVLEASSNLALPQLQAALQNLDINKLAAMPRPAGK